jgi:hypothetical protein
MESVRRQPLCIAPPVVEVVPDMGGRVSLAAPLLCMYLPDGLRIALCAVTKAVPWVGTQGMETPSDV